ncbi:hypothetical protein [Candidatus Magnetominusculus xianensis]|uniref:Secreted protein n=1 Tax=Candidatus Magnetominusculus xianensis TaxID=1748249 RepID=A0ABR5SGV4_9BACT|nr:hypothetical protein [Candidatus Magnetominusculus xianensis]KWT90926.1 hypothetical protein ASN18_1010 [Candidatus Magnetominusculus xianensis]MBF0403081.1 hypothetical protein [Nitrospirota bacterium]
MRLIYLFVIMILFAPVITGCAGSSVTKGDSGQQESQPPTPPMPSQLSLMGTDFEDVDIPDELKLVEGESMLMNTANFAGGSLVYAANVTVDSVVRFFKIQMPKKGWEFMASSFARNNAIIAYRKPNKNCVIHITGPGGWQPEAKVHIWIGNTMNAAPSGNPAPVKPSLK